MEFVFFCFSQKIKKESPIWEDVGGMWELEGGQEMGEVM